MTYLVMECRKSYAVVLDEEGRFLTVANRQYQVGQRVDNVVEMRMAAPRPKGRRRALAALAACLILAAVSFTQLQRMPYASVYMSINPEVRIDVNRWDSVVELEGLNEDGGVLTDGYEYRKKDLDLVMDELVDRAIDLGYLHEGGRISLTLDAKNSQWVSDHETALSRQLNDRLEEKLSVTIVIDDRVENESPVVIPIPAAGSDYGESDYGQSDYGESDYGGSDYGQSDYGEADYSQSDYGESDYGQSDYGGADSGYASDYGDSDYDDDD